MIPKYRGFSKKAVTPKEDKNRLTEIPTNEKCPRVSAINESLLTTTNVPNKGANTPSIIPAINALNMKSCWKRSVKNERNIF
jgi:hypothetical protein